MKRGALLALLLLTSCGGATVAPERGPVARAWTYVFRLDGALTRLEATVCFEGDAPAELGPIDRSGRRYLRSADGPLGPDEAPLPREGSVVLTEHLPPNSCIRYVVDLDAAARQRGGISGAYRIGDDLIASTSVWLWAPRRRAPDARVTARFELPEGVVVSPLWARNADRWFLDERAFEFEAYAAFGTFEVRHVAVPGACLHITLLGRPVAMGPDALTQCLSGSATAASMMLGRFPVREAGILAVPTPLSQSSPFGIVGRGTMPTVAILVGEQATPEHLGRAWVPVHEFSHLATPFIARDHAWLSEGIATYYQEVLRARAGLQSAEDAWRNLDDGFERGRAGGTGRSLADESRDMRETAAYRRVYWAGAAIALAADVEIRVRSGGERSLDDALAHVNECCGSWDRPMTGEEALEHLGTIEGGAFSQIARRALGDSGFPRLEATYRRLGLERDPYGLDFGDDEEARALREQIMRAPESLADVPECGPWNARE
ncbi:MAG: hypothetical protein H6719_23715 [Sandaracinaceae bacterium]|nr:hypothetical protein [Sandaracinaceae bacterium]